MSSLILFGRVISTKDPAGLGRVQVETVGFGERHVLPWTRVLQATASEKTGHFFLPEKGDEVVMLRGLGDRPEGLIVLGALYSAARPPMTPEGDDKNDIKEIRTRAGHALTFCDKEGHESITLTSGDGKLTFTLDQKGGKITLLGDKEIVVTSKSKLNVTAKEITVKGDSKLTLHAKNLKIEGKEIALSGQKVKIA